MVVEAIVITMTTTGGTPVNARVPSTPPPTTPPTTTPPEPIINYSYTGRENLNDDEKFILYYYNKLHNLTNPFNETLTNENIKIIRKVYLNPLTCKRELSEFSETKFDYHFIIVNVRNVFNHMRNSLLNKGLKTYCPDVPYTDKGENFAIFHHELTT